MTYSLPSSGKLPEAPSVLEKSGKQQSGEKDTESPALETNIKSKQKRVLVPVMAVDHPLAGPLDEDNTKCKGSIQCTKEVQKNAHDN